MQTPHPSGMRRVLKAAASLTAIAPLAATAALLQLTPGGDRNSFNASVSDDGQRVVLYSASDLAGANADRNFEIFLYERSTGALRQISNDPSGIFSGSQTAQISGDGSRSSTSTSSPRRTTPSASRPWPTTSPAPASPRSPSRAPSRCRTSAATAAR